MKAYFVVYKRYLVPGTSYQEILADGKGAARISFIESGIKHDYIVKVITK